MSGPAVNTVGSLCSGYGGLDLGLELALGVPLRHAWHVEYDKHPSAILAHRFPGVPNYGDVKTAPYADMERVDWLTAGYPCQPFSTAGARKGADDPRHLWPGVARAISVLRPRRALLENVAGHLSLGFDTVLADLAAMGYDARWGVVRASEAGAPHRRERIFIVATDAERERVAGRRGLRDVGGTPAGGADQGLQRQRDRDAAHDRGPVAQDTDVEPREQRRVAAPGQADDGRRGQDVAWGAYEPAVRRWERATGRDAPRPTEPGRTSGRLSPRFVEWMMGLPAGWVTDVPGLPRNAQLKALGNGVVPQQAALAVRLLTAQAGAVAA